MKSSGRIGRMRRVAAFVMLLCLVAIQAHSFVPHHHHDQSAPLHSHDGDNHWGLHPHASPSLGLEGAHPESAPHDELSLSTLASNRTVYIGPLIALATEASMDLLLVPERVAAEYIYSEHPYATGPPGTPSPRAPPASQTA